MDIVEFREYCMLLPEVEETLPFDDVTIVFKVGGRMFAVIGIDDPSHFVVKCDPDRAVALRERYGAIEGAWHFDKRHWNSIRLDAGLPDGFLRGEIRHSYLLVVRKNVTPKAERERILSLAAAEGVADDSERFD